MLFQGFVALALRVASQVNFSAAQTIDPGSVSPIIRDGWCTSQENVCSTLCNDKTVLNECLLTTLEATCQCDETFLQPYFQLYRGSLPYFVCEEYIRQCVTGNATNTENQAECRAAYACPSLDPSGVTQTSSPPEVSQTPDPSPSPTSSISSPSTSSPPPRSQTTESQQTPSISQTTRSQQSSSSSGSSTIIEESSSARTTTTSSRSSSIAIPSDSTDTPSSTENGSPNSTSDSPSGTPSAGSKGLGTPAIVGIAVGVGVPVMLGALFLAYRLGVRRRSPPVPAPHSAFGKEYGGSQFLGGGNDAGVGFGNEVGGIIGENYGVNRR